MNEMNSLTGQNLGGKYLLGNEIGKGGFGAVYKAIDKKSLNEKAIKVIMIKKQDKEESYDAFQKRLIGSHKRFEREAKTLASLEHPNIVHVDDYGIDQGRPYLVMPFISGGTLRTVIPSNGLNLEQVGIYLRQICEALDYIHIRPEPIVHFDLKPANLLHQNGTLRLSDFGLAHILQEGEEVVITSVIGFSGFYTAPEQRSGSLKRANDIYSLGATLFCMVTGRNPESYTPSAQAIKLTIPSSIDGIIRRAMAMNPDHRYTSAGELFNDFKIKVGLSLPPSALPSVTKNEPIQSSSVPSTLKVIHTKQDTPKQSGNSAARSTNYDWQLPQLQRRAEETTGSLSLNTITPYAQVQLDAPPPLDVMNRLLQEVGKQALQRKQGGDEENK